MPCYQVNLLSVEIKAADRDLLERALRSLKFKYTRIRDELIIRTPNGTITISGEQASLPASAQEELNRIKCAYSDVVIEEAAQRFNWTVSEEDDMIVLRRYSSDT